MPKPNPSHGHGGKLRRGTGAEDGTVKSPLAVRTSSRTTVASKAADVKASTTNITHKACKETGPEVGAGQTHDEPAVSPVARTLVHGWRQGRHCSVESGQLDTALPAVEGHKSSPEAAAAGSQSKVTSPKTSGKREHGEKRPYQPRRGTKPESAALSPLPTAPPSPKTYPEASAADANTKSHPGGTSLRSTSGVKGLERLSRPGSEAIPSSGGASAIPNVCYKASRLISATNGTAKLLPVGKAVVPTTGDELPKTLSPVTSSPVSPLSGTSPIHTVASDALSVPDAAARFPPDMVAMMRMAGTEAPEKFLPVISVAVSPAGGMSPIPTVTCNALSTTNADVMTPQGGRHLAPTAGSVTDGLSPITSIAVSALGGMSVPVRTPALQSPAGQRVHKQPASPEPFSEQDKSHSPNCNARNEDTGVDNSSRKGGQKCTAHSKASKK